MNKIIRKIFIATMLVALPLSMVGCYEEDYSYEPVNVGQLQPASYKVGSAEYKEKYAYLGSYGEYGKDEPITITVAAVDYPLESGIPSSTTVRNQTFNQIALETLNIKLEYVVIGNTSNYDTNLNLYFANGLVPDMFYTTNAGTYAELLQDGALADLSDAFWYLRDELRENYLEYFPELLPTVMQDSKLYSFPTITNQYATAQRLYIRKDWLDLLGLQVPTTMEEFYAVGKAFAENKDKIAAATGLKKASNVIPFTMNKELTWSGSYSIEGFLNCFGTSMNAYFEGEDGNLYYSNTSQEMKAALTMLRDMYSEGILDKDFMTKGADQVQANINSGFVGMTFGEWWMPKDVLDDCIARVDGAEWVWVNLPGIDGEAQPIVKSVNVSGYNLVSSSCKYPEACAKLINLFYDIYYSDDAQQRYGDKVLPSNGFYYQFVPVKLWDGIASIREYKRAQEVFNNLYDAGFDPSNYVDTATYAADGIMQKVSSTTAEDYVVSKVDNVSYIINRDVINAINSNPTWKTEFNKLKNREKTLHFVDGYPYFVAYKKGKKLSEMAPGERAGWGIYHEMIDPEGGYAYVVDLTEKVCEAKYDRFYGANLSAMTDKLPYITTQTGVLFARMIVGELSIDKFESDYVKAVFENNGGKAVMDQVNAWYKSTKIDVNEVYALVKGNK